MNGRVSVKLVPNPGVGRVDLCRWIKKCHPDTYLKDALLIGDLLLGGGTWEPNYYSFNRLAAAENSPWAIVTITSPYEEYDRQQAIVTAEQREFYELCTKGAAGDAEAAIAYCKLELEGRVSHAAFAG